MKVSPGQKTYFRLAERDLSMLPDPCLWACEVANAISICLYAHERSQESYEEARQVVEQLNRDAGYEPIYTEPHGKRGALQKNFRKLVFALNRGGLDRFFYRLVPPDRL